MEDMEVLGEFAVDHLRVDILAYQLHIATDVPELLPDLEVLAPTFVIIDVETYSLALVIEDDVLVVAQGCFCLLVAPFSWLKGLHRFDLIELLSLENLLPS